MRAITLGTVSMSPLLLLFAPALLVVGGGCGQRAVDEEPPDGEIVEVIARVGEREISASEFEAYLALERLGDPSEEVRDRALSEYLQHVALAEAILDEEALDDDAIAAEVEQYRNQLIIARYFDEYLEREIDDDAVEAHYASNSSEFERLVVHPRHIFFRVDWDGAEETIQAQRTSAQAAWSALQRGEPFEQVAAESSEDRITAGRGGDLGWVEEGAVSPTFSSTVFAAQVGDLLEPFDAEHGIHIVEIMGGPQTESVPFDEVRGRIRSDLRTQARRRETERLQSSLEVSP